MTVAETPDCEQRLSQRIDQWLCYARFFKTRSLAAKIVQSKGIRVDGAPRSKPGTLVRPNQTLTFIAGERVRVVKILGLAPRRGPASEAVLLYEDLSLPRPPKAETGEARIRGSGRPTKKDRRAIAALKGDGNA